MGTLNFDLFFGKDGQPRAVIGNFQGNQQEDILGFKQKLGKTPFDVLLGQFVHAFPQSHQLVALNVRRHYYREHLQDDVVARSMEFRGKLSKEEREAIENRKFELQLGLLQATRKVQAEKERIQRETTGMHKAAFKKAGFKTTSKSRYWRRVR